MHQTLFRSWKIAALWAIGISASIAAFFSEGGGHEQLEESAQQIREKRGNPHRQDDGAGQPVAQPVAAAPAADEAEEAAEPEFDEPSIDPGVDGEEPATLGPAAAQPAPAAEEEL